MSLLGRRILFWLVLLVVIGAARFLPSDVRAIADVTLLAMAAVAVLYTLIQNLKREARLRQAATKAEKKKELHKEIATKVHERWGRS